MDSLVLASTAFAIIFGAALLGLRLRGRIPEHLTGETKDSVRLGMGLIATMTALLLGLLVASAKGSFDAQRSEVIQMSARVAYLDRVLSIYGPEAAEGREALRDATRDLIHQLWPEKSGQPSEVPDIAVGLRMYNSIQKLSPQDDAQRQLKAQAMDSVIDIGKTRWLLFAQRDRAISKPLLVAVILWLAITFLSFGLFAPSNKIVIYTFFIVALSVCSAIFLMLDLDRPFQGVNRISSSPMQSVLSELGH
jgi:hypothetical protein